jgi:hypothetical protein
VSDLFGQSKYPKRLDPALAGFSDAQLEAARELMSWVTHDEISAELSQRARNRELAAQAERDSEEVSEAIRTWDARHGATSS